MRNIIEIKTLHYRTCIKYNTVYIRFKKIGANILICDYIFCLRNTYWGLLCSLSINYFCHCTVNRVF